MMLHDLIMCMSIYILNVFQVQRNDGVTGVIR
jgi:hypothetical protein